MNFNVTGWNSQLTIPVYNKSGATLAKGTILACDGAVLVVDSANPNKRSFVPSVVDAETGAGQSPQAYIGVAQEDIESGTVMDEDTTPDLYRHDGLGTAVLQGLAEVEAGGTIVAGEPIYLDVAAGVVNFDGVIGAADSPATDDLRIGIALEAGSDGDLIDALLLTPVFYP